MDPGAKFCQGCGCALPAGPDTTGSRAITAAFQRPLTQLDVLRHATLGEYEILHELGHGGMATVYLAHDIALDRKIAVKVMSAAYLHGPEMVARFKREARTVASLNHPHIIPIYAVKETQGLLYFVMKYVKGRSLDQILRDVGPLPFPMIRCILADIGSALDYAHRQGVVHRDVKPGNILVDEEGFAVVTDFGIAKAAETDGLTQSGTTVGTPSYLSPEACSGERVTAAADQYSLGIVAYEMLTAQLPFVAESSMGMMYAQVHTPPRPSNMLRGDVPADLHHAIMRMLEKSPEDRFPSLRDAVAAVSGGVPAGDDSVRSHVGLLAVPRPGRPVDVTRRTPTSPIPLGRPSAEPPVATPASRRSRDRRRAKTSSLGWIAAALVLIAAVAAGSAFIATHSQRPVLPDSVITPNVPLSDGNDSLLLVARGAATLARQRAITSGATARALALGDSVEQRAESLARRGLKAEAAVLLTEASVLWGQAERAAAPATRSAPPSAPPRQATVSVTPLQVVPSSGVTAPSLARAGEPQPSDSQLIVDFYAELALAIESRQLGEVKRLLPNMTQTEERSWRDIFDDKDLQAIDAVFTVQKVTRNGDEAHARVYVDLNITKKGKIDHKGRTELTTLTRGPQGWRQIRAERQ